MGSVVLKPKRCVYLVKSEIAHNSAPGTASCSQLIKDIVVCALERMLCCMGLDKKGFPKCGTCCLLNGQRLRCDSLFFIIQVFLVFFFCGSSELQNVVGTGHSGYVVRLSCNQQ